INMYSGRIVRMFRWAASEELLRGDVWQQLAALRGLQRGRTEARESEPVRPVDDATVSATVEHLGPIVADMVRLQMLAGMRPGEVCLIRPTDIDRTDEVWTYTPESHKTEHHGRKRI